MSEEKLAITQEMVDSFADMIKSKDSKDVKFAVDILELRDTNDVESEKHFQQLAKLIISDEKLFPTSKEWIIKIGDKRLELKNSKSSWYSKESAERALSAHLTEYLGKSAKNVSFSKWSDKKLVEQAKWKSISPQDEQEKLKNTPKPSGAASYWIRQNYNKLIRPSGPEYIYDPKFDKKKFLQKEREKRAKDMGAYGRSDQYFKAMKMVFGGGKELRDFLVKNNIVEFVQL